MAPAELASGAGIARPMAALVTRTRRMDEKCMVTGGWVVMIFGARVMGLTKDKRVRARDVVVNEEEFES